jgi:hypothetical protein
VIGVVTLDATRSGEPIAVTAIPLLVDASSGVNLSTLSQCALYSSAGTKLTTGGNAVAQVVGTNTLKFDKPLNVPATQGMLLVLRCSVASTAPIGGAYMFSLPPSDFQATNSKGDPIMVTQGVAANGQPGTNKATITIGSASGATSTMPGLPNTGAGGNAAGMWSILILSGIVALLAGRSVLVQSNKD